MTTALSEIVDRYEHVTRSINPTDQAVFALIARARAELADRASDSKSSAGNADVYAYNGWTANELDTLFIDLDLMSVPPDARKKRIDTLRRLLLVGKRCSQVVWGASKDGDNCGAAVAEHDERERKLAELAKEVHDSFKEGWILRAHDWMRRYEEACK